MVTRKAASRKKTKKKKASAKKSSTSAKKLSSRVKLARSGKGAKSTAKKVVANTSKRQKASRRGDEDVTTVRLEPRGPSADVLSGDAQGLSEADDVSSESVEELVSEGQAFEAGLVSGVEDAPTPDRSEIKTREVLEDDVPSEYDDQDRP